MPRGHDNDFLILDFGDTNLFREHYLFVHRIGSGGVQSPPLVCEIGTWLEPAR